MLTLHTNLNPGEIGAKPTTQITGYDFNSYCKFNGEHLACSSTSLAEIGGDTFGGVSIDAEIEFMDTDLGTQDKKRMQYVFYSGTASGDLEWTTTFDRGSPMPPVEITRISSNVVQTVKTKLAEGEKGVYITCNLKNKDGCDFVINKIELLPTIIKHY